jgi:hypothetical protein
MRALWIAIPLVLSTQLPLTAQSPGDSRARQAQMRADSIKRAREDRADSIRRRNPSDARRIREDQARIREQAADSIRRRIAPNRLEPVPTRPVQLASTRRLDSIPLRRDIITPPVVRPPEPAIQPSPDPAEVRPEPSPTRDPRPAARPASPPVTTLSSAASMPAPNRVRAALMRMRDRVESPSFCRSGAGHPVYGRDWCWERGFRLGEDWDRNRGAGLRLEPPAGSPIDQSVLSRMFDAAFMTRLQNLRRSLGLNAPLNGSWMETTVGGRLLSIRAGSTPIAEISDRNRDGRADAMWLRTVPSR